MADREAANAEDVQGNFKGDLAPGAGRGRKKGAGCQIEGPKAGWLRAGDAGTDRIKYVKAVGDFSRSFFFIARGGVR